MQQNFIRIAERASSKRSTYCARIGGLRSLPSAVPYPPKAATRTAYTEARSQLKILFTLLSKDEISHDAISHDRVSTRESFTIEPFRSELLS